MGIPIQELQPIASSPEGLLWRRIKALEARMAAKDADPRRSYFSPEYWRQDTVIPRSISSGSYPGSPVAGAPQITIDIPGRYYIRFGGSPVVNAAAGANDMRVGAFVNGVLQKECALITAGAGGGCSINDLVPPVDLDAGDVVDVRYRSVVAAAFQVWGGWLSLQPLRVNA